MDEAQLWDGMGWDGDEAVEKGIPVSAVTAIAAEDPRSKSGARHGYRVYMVNNTAKVGMENAGFGEALGLRRQAVWMVWISGRPTTHYSFYIERMPVKRSQLSEFPSGSCAKVN